MSDLSKTQIDRLGDRLRKGNISEADFKMLDIYRKSFGIAYENVIIIIRENLKLEPTGRPAKSTTSIFDKLHREKIRLSQMQDIAGCRIVVKDVQEQNRVIDLIRGAFSSVSTVDRRIKPNYGYRAVHLIVRTEAKLIEVQVRTELQHNWAELSEKFSDKIDPAIKYGGGSRKTQDYLSRLSNLIKNYERMEADFTDEELKRELAVLKIEITERTKIHSFE